MSSNLRLVRMLDDEEAEGERAEGDWAVGEEREVGIEGEAAIANAAGCLGANGFRGIAQPLTKRGTVVVALVGEGTFN